MASKPPPSDRLAVWLTGQRWFGAKSRRIERVDVDDSIALEGGALHVLRVTLDDGEVQRYAAPLSDGDFLRDALDDPSFVQALAALVRDERAVRGRHQALAGHRTRAFVEPGRRVRKLGGEQSNTSIALGDTLILKHFRRIADGVNPDLEITRFLTDIAAFPHTPALAGWLTYGDGEAAVTLGVLQHLVGDGRDGWEWMLAALRSTAHRSDTVLALRQLGEATAGLHVALARAPHDDPAMAPEPVADRDIARWSAAVIAQLAAARSAVPPGTEVPNVAGELVAEALAALRGRSKCRHHGDFHLGQTLYRETAGAWAIIDFEGEPLRPLPERRRKHSPLRDVAGMLRSIAYAAETVRANAGTWIDAWQRDARQALLDGYLTTAAGAPFLPEDPTAIGPVIAAFELEKAAYEVVYEANNRPDWIGIPIAGLLRASASVRPRRDAAPGAA